MSKKIRAEVYPITDNSKHWMSANQNETIEKFRKNKSVTTLSSCLTWIANPDFSGDEDYLVNIKRTNEEFSVLKNLKGYEQVRGNPIYCAEAEIPSNYFNTYKSKIESTKRFEVRRV